jgi:hypothetical protein
MIVVVHIFRECELIDLIVLLIINVITKILFKRLILTFCLLIRLWMKCDVIAKRKLQVIAKYKSIFQREEISSIDYNNFENFEFNKKFFYQCVNKLNCDSVLSCLNISSILRISIYDNKNKVVCDFFIYIKRQVNNKIHNSF